MWLEAALCPVWGGLEGHSPWSCSAHLWGLSCPCCTSSPSYSAGDKKGACPMATYLHAGGEACREARAQARWPLCLKRAAKLHVALMPLPLSTVPGTVTLECLAMTRAKIYSLCPACWTCPTLFRIVTHSHFWSSGNLQVSWPFVILSLLFMLSQFSSLLSKARPTTDLTLAPGRSVCSGATRSPGKLSVSCQGETWTTET